MSPTRDEVLSYVQEELEVGGASRAEDLRQRLPKDDA